MARMCRKANSSTLLGECKLLWPLWKTVWRFLKKLKTKLSWVHVCMLSCIYCAQLYDPMHCSPTGSSFHGILQARILEWVAMPSSRGFSWPRDRTHVSYISCTSRQVLYHWYHLGSLPYDPAIPLMGIYIWKKNQKNKKKQENTKLKIHKHNLYSSIIYNKENNPNYGNHPMSITRRMDKDVRHIYNLTSSLSIYEQWIITEPATCIDLEDFMLSGRGWLFLRNRRLRKPFFSCPS